MGLDRNPWWGDAPLPVAEGDLGDRTFVRRMFGRWQPEAVIHCAAMVDVDACELDPQRASDMNVRLTRVLLEQMPAESLFVYISTDSVFDGASSLRTEEHQPSPINVYGKTKLEAERMVARVSHHLIVRTNFYGWSSGRKKTSAEWMWDALDHGKPITLFEDFFFTPIYVVDLVRLLNLLVQRNARGIFHVGGRDRVSKYEFGSLMARGMGASMDRVSKGALERALLRAPRPQDISLSSKKAERFLGMRVPDCEEGVARFVFDRGRTLTARVPGDA